MRCKIFLCLIRRGLKLCKDEAKQMAWKLLGVWVRRKPKKGAFANGTVNGSRKVVEEVGECENEWLMVTGKGNRAEQCCCAAQPCFFSHSLLVPV